MKLLLVRPYHELKIAKVLQESFLRLEPLELEIVAGGVSAQDEVKILDLGLYKNPREVFTATLKEYAPQMVGFSGFSSQAYIVKQLAGLAKEIDPAIITIVGGLHATVVPDDYKTAPFDLIVRGEGGTQIGQIIENYKKQISLEIPGRALVPHDPAFDAKAAMPIPPYPEADSIPMPRRDLVNADDYFCVWTSSDTGKLDQLFPPTATLRTTLGCAFRCSFCVVHHVMGGKYLQRDEDRVVDEIAGLKQDYIYFVDDEMFLNIPRAESIAKKLMARGVKKRYISWARSDTIVKHPEVFRLWKKAGLDTVYVGLESMDEARLKEYSKNGSVDTNRQAIEILRSIPIVLHSAYIVHPDFGPEDFTRLEKQIEFMSPAETTFTVLSPSPGTQFWHEHKHRFICDPYRFYDCMHAIIPVKMPLKLFYRHFGRLSALALRANPLRVKKVKVRFKDFWRAIIGGTRFIFCMYTLYKDYPREMWDK